MMGSLTPEGIGARLDDLQSLIEGALLRLALNGGLHGRVQVLPTPGAMSKRLL